MKRNQPVITQPVWSPLRQSDGNLLTSPLSPPASDKSQHCSKNRPGGEERNKECAGSDTLALQFTSSELQKVSVSQRLSVKRQQTGLIIQRHQSYVIKAIRFLHKEWVCWHFRQRQNLCAHFEFLSSFSNTKRNYSSTFSLFFHSEMLYDIEMRASIHESRQNWQNWGRLLELWGSTNLRAETQTEVRLWFPTERQRYCDGGQF